jgi:hypothetical protein
MTHTEDERWHSEEEAFLENLEKQCNDLYDHNIQEYQYYHGMAAKFNIPILIISSINALCAISLNDFLSQTFVSILNAILSAGTGVLGSIQLYMKLNERMTNALRASINLKKLALKISKELTIARKDRSTEGQAFLADCFAEFNTVIEQGNPVERKIANHLSFIKDEGPKQSPSPLMRVADRFIKMAKIGPSVRASLDEERTNYGSVGSKLSQFAGISIKGSGGGTPENEV